MGDWLGKQASARRERPFRALTSAGAGRNQGVRPKIRNNGQPAKLRTITHSIGGSPSWRDRMSTMQAKCRRTLPPQHRRHGQALRRHFRAHCEGHREADRRAPQSEGQLNNGIDGGRGLKCRMPRTLRCSPYSEQISQNGLKSDSVGPFGDSCAVSDMDSSSGTKASIFRLSSGALTIAAFQTISRSTLS